MPATGRVVVYGNAKPAGVSANGAKADQSAARHRKLILVSQCVKVAQSLLAYAAQYQSCMKALQLRGDLSKNG